MQTLECIDDVLGAVPMLHGPVGFLDALLEGIAPAVGSEDRAPEVGDAADRLGVESNDAVILEEAVVAPADPVHLPALVQAG